MRKSNAQSNTMLRHEISMSWETIVRCWKTFGMDKKMLAPLFVKPAFLFMNRLSFALDNFYFDQLKETDVPNPVFITGHPRSGTTFLHRMLTQTGEFACFEFWHTIFPSLISRYAFSPFERFLRKMGKGDVLFKNSGHYTSLNSIEEEEFLLLGCCNSPMTTLFTALAFGTDDYWDIFHFEKQPTVLKKQTIVYLKECFKRQIYYSGRKQILAKMPYAMLRFESLLHVFPEAKFIYLIRSPHEVVPSYLSLIRAILDSYWGLHHLSPSLLKTIYKRVYLQSIRYYEWIEALEDKGVLNPKQFLILPYHQLKTDLAGILTVFLAFTGIQIGDNLRHQIMKQAEKQKVFKREHQNLPLEDFGFSTHCVDRDFSFVIDKYNFD